MAPSALMKLRTTKRHTQTHAEEKAQRETEDYRNWAGEQPKQGREKEKVEPQVAGRTDVETRGNNHHEER